MIPKILTFALQMVGALWMFLAGGYAIWEYDRAPAGWPNYQVKCCLVVRFTFHMPWAGAVTAANAKYAGLVDKNEAAARHAAQVAQRQGQVTQQAQARAVAVETQIRWRTRTIIQEAPLVLTPDTDRRYPLPVGFVRLYDASLLGRDLSAIPDPAGRPDDAPSGIAPSAAGAVVAGNNGECLADRARLIGLQQWIRDEAAAAR